MMDKVSLHGIDVYAYHGVHPAERELGQRFVIDADLWIDCDPAASSDSLSQALDYTAVHRCINESTAGSSYHLIEALAGHLCRVLLESFPVDRVQVTVQKPNPPIANFLGRAAVTFVRERSWLDRQKAEEE